MKMEALRARLRKRLNGKAPGRNGIPYEHFKYGLQELHDFLLAAIMSGVHERLAVKVQIG